MVSVAHRVRTGIALAAAGGTIVAALLLHHTPAHDRVQVVRDEPDESDGLVVSARARDEHLAVTIAVPAGGSPGNGAHAPVSVAIVIDRSSSMRDSAEARPFSNAKAAAARLIDRLGDGDAFAIVGYTDSATTYVPMTVASSANKQRARAALAELEPAEAGATCISCGLTLGDGELARSPIGGIRRMLLISDGVANSTLSGSYADAWRGKDEALQVASDAAKRGRSISTIGVGLGFDEATMINLADVGRGNYYFVEDTRDLEKMFDAELRDLQRTVATDVELVVRDASVEEAYGYPVRFQQEGAAIPVADLRAGETRKIVLRVRRTGAAEPHVELFWRRVSDGVGRHVVTTATDDAGPATAQVIAEALASRTLQHATKVYERDGAAAAQQVIEDGVITVRRNGVLAPTAVQAIESQYTIAGRAFAAAPDRGDAGEKAKKAVLEQAHQLAR